jgi:hypothetical protein
VRVTQRVVDQVNRQGESAQQIAITGTGAGELRSRVSLLIGETECSLVKRDTHAFWYSHQTPETRPYFEELFARLADDPDRPIGVTVRPDRVDGQDS